MTPKLKAKELVEKYLPLSDDGGYYDDVCYNSGDDKEKNAKQCALIAVEEIIKNELDTFGFGTEGEIITEYWQEAKSKKHVF